jgi:UDP-N-acetylglucosamine transferase subunit ALG13
MIFVSVGMQMPFDRLCGAVDEWAGRNKRKDVFMQIGETKWSPTHCNFERMISPPEFRQHIEQASLLIMHAGIGSIVTGIECGVPMILMPRLARLKETRNDHQTATLRRLGHLPGIKVCGDEQELVNELTNFNFDERPIEIGPDASPQLIQKLQSFIEGTG